MRDPLRLNYYIYCKGNPIKYIDPSGNMTESAGELSKLAEIIAAIGGMLYNPGSIVKNATPAGVFVTVLLTPSKAGETEEDLKNDLDFQKSLSGNTGDTNNNNKKDDKNNGAGTVTKGKSQAPATGKPGSIYEQVNDKGNLKSRTKYGSNGKAEYREDFDHPHFDKKIENICNHISILLSTMKRDSQ